MGEDLPRAAGMFAAGSRIGGYLLEEQIGHGGMAVVFKAMDDRLGRPVALKILAPALAADPAFRQRFMRESRAAAAVDDPHIIPLYGAGEADGVLFIAMRYVGAGDVRSLLFREGMLPGERVAGIVSPVASALDAAHAAGLVHRDVKPANMLLDVRPGRPDHVYLSDFGLSKEAAGSVGLTGTGLFLGTVDYAAPEQVSGHAVDGRADQYALACAAFEMLCGKPPFRRDQGMAVLLAHLNEAPPQVTARRAGLPAEVDAVLTRALAKSPGDRYRTCGEFSAALRAALGIGRYDEGFRGAHPRTEFVRAASEQAGPDAAGLDPAVLDSVGQDGVGQDTEAMAQPAGWPEQPDTPVPGGWAGPSDPPVSGGWPEQPDTPVPGGWAGPSDPPVPGGWAGQPIARRRAGRWPVAAAVTAVAVVAIVGVALVLSARSGPATPLSAGSNSPAARSRPAPVPSGHQAGQPSPAASPATAPLAGWATYHDPSGFSIATPPGWAVSSTSADEVKFTGADSGFTVVVAWTNQPRPDALADWRQQAAGKAATDPTYHQISITRVTYRGYNAADWQFANDLGGQQVRVLDRGFIVRPGQLAYAIELYGPAGQWQQVYDSTWGGLVTSFSPAP